MTDRDAQHPTGSLPRDAHGNLVLYGDVVYTDLERKAREYHAALRDADRVRAFFTSHEVKRTPWSVLWLNVLTAVALAAEYNRGWDDGSEYT